jgi:sodium-dependent dicarboxylate transporter 2/3/5
MIATAFLSMWISNLATAMLMVPIGTAVMTSLGPVETSDQAPAERSVEDDLVAGIRTVPDELPASDFGLALMLGIAYSASAMRSANTVGITTFAIR